LSKGNKLLNKGISGKNVGNAVKKEEVVEEVNKKCVTVEDTLVGLPMESIVQDRVHFSMMKEMDSHVKSSVSSEVALNIYQDIYHYV
jgi:hypothetical protein